MKIKKGLTMCLVVVMIFGIANPSFYLQTEDELEEENEEKVIIDRIPTEKGEYEEERSNEDDLALRSSSDQSSFREKEKFDLTNLDPREPIHIYGDEGFQDVADEGNGSEENPWIIEGYEIDGDEYEEDYGFGILIESTTDHFIIENCFITDISYDSDEHPGMGIALNDVKNGTLKNNEVEQTDMYGISINDSEGNIFTGNNIIDPDSHGIHIRNSDDNEFDDLYIARAEDGFYIEGDCHSNNFMNSEVTGSSNHGIHIDGAFESNVLTDLTIDNNDKHGIYISDDHIFADNNIEGCGIRSNTKDGIRIEENAGSDGSGDNTIQDNIIKENAGYGIYLSHRYNQLDENIIEGNVDYQIYFDELDHLSNYFTDNTLNGVRYYHLFEQDNTTVGPEEYDFDSYQKLTNYGGVVFYESENISLEEVYIEMLESRGMTIHSSQDVDLTDFEVTYCKEKGIWIENTERVDLDGFEIKECEEEGLLVQSTNGIYMKDFEVNNCTREGIFIEDSKDIYLMAFEIANCESDGIRIENPENNIEAVDFKISNCEGKGIGVGSIEYINLEKFNITECTDDGVAVGSSGEVNLSDFNVTDCEGDGIFIDEAERIIDLTSFEVMNCDGEGVSIGGAKYVNLTGFKVYESGERGVSIGSSGEVNFLDFNVTDCGGDGIFIDEAERTIDLSSFEVMRCDGKGVSMGEAGEVNLSDFNISDCGGDGISISGSENNIDLTSFEVMRCDGKGVSIGGAKYVNLTGFKVHESGERGVSIGSSGEVNLSDFKVTECESDGVAVRDAGFVDLADLEIKDCSGNGLSIEDTEEVVDLTDFKVTDCQEAGIYISNLDDITLENVTALRNGKGIHFRNLESGDLEEIRAKENDRGSYIEKSRRITISKSIFKSNIQEGIYLDEVNFIRIRRSNIIANEFGIVSEGGSENSRIFKNEILNNEKDGVQLLDGTRQFGIENNTISNHGRYGIHVGEEASLINPIANNSIMANLDYGIHIEGNNNQIFNNKFMFNNDSNLTYNSTNIQAYDSGDITDWRAEDKRIGNYWWDWMDKYDAEEDEGEDVKVINESYVIDGETETEDPYPLYAEIDSYELTIGVEGEGSIEPREDTYTFYHGEPVMLEAEPEEDYIFSHWTGDYPRGDREDKEIRLVMDDDKELTAHFVSIESLFEVEIIEYDEEVVMEEELHVTVEVHNLGNMDDTQEIELRDFEGEIVDSQELTLSSNEADQITLSWNTGKGDIGTDNISVHSDDDKDGVEVTVFGPYFEVNIVEYDDEVKEGDTLAVDFTIENNGDVDSEQQIVFSVDGDEEDSMYMMIGAGESESSEFEWEADETGIIDLKVASEDDSETVTVTVLESYFEVEITDYDDEVKEGATVTVEFTIENTGDLAGEQEIVFSVNGIYEDTMDMTIGAGESDTGEFKWEAEEIGDMDLEVASGDDSDTVTVTVEEERDMMTIIGIIVIIIIILAIIGYVIKGRHTEEPKEGEYSEEKEPIEKPKPPVPPSKEEFTREEEKEWMEEREKEEQWESEGRGKESEYESKPPIPPSKEEL